MVLDNPNTFDPDAMKKLSQNVAGVVIATGACLSSMGSGCAGGLAAGVCEMIDVNTGIDVLEEFYEIFTDESTAGNMTVASDILIPSISGKLAATKAMAGDGSDLVIELISSSLTMPDLIDDIEESRNEN